MTIRIISLLLLIVLVTSCKKQCAEQSYGDLTFQNKTAHPLKIKLNNTIPTGCISDNNGYLYAGASCTTQATAGLQHSVIVYSDSNTTYWHFEISVGPCGSRIIEIQ